MDKKIKVDLQRNQLLTAKDLLARKNLIARQKCATFEIDVENFGAFKFRTPTIDDIEDAQKFKDGDSQDDYIIYTCSVEPNLRNAELQEGFECSEPFDIVEKLFLPGVIPQIAEKIVQKAGFKAGSVTLVEDIKN